MKLYQNPASPPCRRVLALMYELGLTAELQMVEFQSPLLQTSSYLQKNPNGTIPLLEDGDYVLWESLAIMEYLCAKQGSELHPKELKARLEVTRWCAWDAFHLSPAANGFIWENLVKKMMNLGDPDQAALAKSANDFHKRTRVLDQHLAASPYVAGPRLTMADFALASTLMYAEQARMPVEAYTNLRDWYRRIEATEGWKKSAPSI